MQKQAKKKISIPVSSPQVKAFSEIYPTSFPLILFPLMHREGKFSIVDAIPGIMLHLSNHGLRSFPVLNWLMWEEQESVIEADNYFH
jgi:hypothetical protein